MLLIGSLSGGAFVSGIFTTVVSSSFALTRRRWVGLLIIVTSIALRRMRWRRRIFRVGCKSKEGEREVPVSTLRLGQQPALRPANK